MTGRMGGRDGPGPPDTLTEGWYIVNLTRIGNMVASRSSREWTIAERILERKEVLFVERWNRAFLEGNAIRMHRLHKNLRRIAYLKEAIDEKWACLHSHGAAECAGYSDYLACKGDWEARTGERWSGDDY